MLDRYRSDRFDISAVFDQLGAKAGAPLLARHRRHVPSQRQPQPAVSDADANGLPMLSQEAAEFIAAEAS